MDAPVANPIDPPTPEARAPAPGIDAARPSPPRATLAHYAIEALLLAALLLAACAYATALEHPSSALRRAIADDDARRLVMGLLMAVTVLAILYSRPGRITGPLLNPAMVLTFRRLGRLTTRQAAGFIAAQFAGATLGVGAAALLLDPHVAAPQVRYAATLPGAFGLLAAWAGEFAIAAVLASAVMAVNRVPRLVPYGGAVAAALVGLFIAVEAPVSGMSLNPARTFGSSVFAGAWTGWWIYLTAPVAGMLFGAELVRRARRDPATLCGKLTHDPRCFLRCSCLEHAPDDRTQLP